MLKTISLWLSKTDEKPWSSAFLERFQYYPCLIFDINKNIFFLSFFEFFDYFDYGPQNDVIKRALLEKGKGK